MQTAFLLTFVFGCALATQPYIWDNSTCTENLDAPDNYIILGEDAPDGKFPYMLSMSSEKESRHSCGASILTKNWALTAAHCCAVLAKTPHHLKSGTNSLKSGGKIHKMEKYLIHEQYMPQSSWKNDVCLIRVKDPFVFGPKVKQVTLPQQNTQLRDGEFVDITGWGLTKPDGKVCPEKLQLGKNFVALSPAKCQAITGQSHASYLCVVGGQKGQGVCNGDSGSPLVKNGVQFGVASWVYLPCGCGKPDFYARVPTFIDWIKAKLGPEASELKFAS